MIIISYTKTHQFKKADKTRLLLSASWFLGQSGGECAAIGAQLWMRRAA
jgi:hypothetical protein